MTNKMKQKNTTNKTHVTYRTYKSYRTYLSYVTLFVLFFSFFFQPAPTARAGFLSRPPTNLGLVGYWPMDEGAGSKAGDFSGSGNTGTITGATWTNGKKGKALNFDGSSSYIRSATFPNFPTTTMTACVWLKTTSSSSMLIFQQNRSLSYYNNEALFNTSSGKLLFWDYGASAYGFDGTTLSNTSLNDGKWHLGCFVKNGTSGTYYLDGNQDGTKTAASNVSYGTNDFVIGKDYRDDNTFFNGSIDDVRIYNRVLTASEISKIYSSGQTALKKVSEQGLVGYWAMNEGQGVKAGDSSGMNNTGTITGATWTSGKKGKGLSFNGSSYINAGTSDTLNTTGDFSASLWFKTPGPGLNSWDTMLARSNVAYYVNAPNKGWNIISRNISGTNAINFQYSGASAAQQVSWTGGADNLWHHVVTVRQGNLFSLYIDSILKSSLTTAVGDMSMPGETLFIGKGRFSDYFHGSLDDVRIYNRALSAGEVQSIYKQNETMVNAPQNDKLTNGLVGLWSFNGKDISGTTAYDRSGQGNNGTIAGGAKPDAGKVGQALSFDGVDGVVSVSTLTTPMLPVTISAWVKVKASDLQACDGLIFSDSSVSAINIGGCSNSAKVGYHWNSDMNTYNWTGGPTIPTDKWFLVVLVVESDKATAYAYSTDGFNSAVNSVPHSAVGLGGLKIGTDGRYAPPERYFNGLIDEVRIYNRALSGDEVKQLYRMGQ
jgi:hypothetical protein